MASSQFAHSHSSLTSRGLARMAVLLTSPQLLAVWTVCVLGGALGQDIVCGTKFHDLPSSALLAPLVLVGHVQRLDPVTSSSRDEEHVRVSSGSGALYQAEVRVHAVFKGGELLTQGPPDGNSTRSDVTVQGMGEGEDKEQCVGHVVTGQSYLFFLRPQSAVGQDSVFTSTRESVSVSATSLVADDPMTRSPLGAAVFANTALPQGADRKALRTVRKALCPGCASLPIIQRVKCKNCATVPVLKRRMSSKDTKVLRAGRRLSLRCAAKGSPRPAYIWLKDGQVIHDSSKEEKAEKEGRPVSVFTSGSLKIRNTKQYSVLIVNQMTPEDAGIYSCLVANPMGEAAQSVEVKVKGQHPTTPRPTFPPTTAPLSDSTADADHHACSEPPCDVTSRPSPSPSRSAAQEEEDDPCTVNPCYNGGSCLRDENEVARVRCQCLPDYHGNTCQFRRRVAVEDEGVDYIYGDDYETDDDDDSDNAYISSSDNDTLSSSSSSVDNSTSSGGIQQTTSIQTTPPSPSSLAQRVGRRLSKKKSSKRRLRPGSSKTGAPKLQVSECPDQDYCLNGGTCKIVVLLQRRFCECVGNYGGRRCEQQL